jgi:hypothetical protein
MRAEPEMNHHQNDDHQQHQRGEIFCAHRSSNETVLSGVVTLKEMHTKLKRGFSTRLYSKHVSAALAGCSEITGRGEPAARPLLRTNE